MSPTSEVFAQWITSYTSQINGYIGVSTDICAFGDATHTSETIVDVIATLLEARFVYYDDVEKTPLSERGQLEIPNLKMPRYAYLRETLEDLKGQIPTVASSDPPAFNFDLDTISGGFD